MQKWTADEYLATVSSLRIMCDTSTAKWYRDYYVKWLPILEVDWENYVQWTILVANMSVYQHNVSIWFVVMESLSVQEEYKVDYHVMNIYGESVAYFLPGNFG